MAGDHTTRSFRIMVTDAGADAAREVCFESRDAETALRVARQVCGHRRVQLFEEDRQLADLRRSRHHGFWIAD